LNLHIHAALNVGCTKEEIAEVIFQTSIYGGVPAANTALKVLKQVLEEREEGLSREVESLEEKS
jgi:alkylhydroperoxidase/carboxymuconolactone decarboxylase family protein YurZ